MRVLLDECIDLRFARELSGHEVTTARQMGWTGFRNGQLLGLAAERFDAFITVDRNLQFQQDLQRFALAVVVLRVRSNRLSELRLLAPKLLELLPLAERGRATLV
jgi:hypothetical protein